MKKILLLYLLYCVLFPSPSEPRNDNDVNPTIFSRDLPDPMEDRAVGYLLEGKAKSAVTNYGDFITWNYHPSGLWNDYTYLPELSFMAGIPGQSYSYRYEWFTSTVDEVCPISNNTDIKFWCSTQAYNQSSVLAGSIPWFENGDTNFVSVIFDN